MSHLKLHEVCERGDSYQVAFWISAKNVNSQNSKGETPLHIASKYGNLKAIKVLVSCAESNLHIVDEKGNTPLHTACMHGHYSIVELLVADQRCQLNTQNGKGETSFHLACRYGHLSTAKVLLSKKECNFNVPNEQGDTPLHVACKYGHHSTVEFLVADQRCNPYKHNALHTAINAIKDGRLDVIKVLLSKCDLNIPDENGNTLLHIACKHGDSAIVETLVTCQRCQLNTQNREGKTPLHIASECGFTYMVKTLMRFEDCDPNISDDKGNTPLHTACKHGHHSVIESLFADERCQLNTQNREGKTPLHIAAEFGNMYTVRTLLSCNDCDPDISDEKGNTPIHIACKHSHCSIVESLVVDQRCQIKHWNREDEISLHSTACKHGHHSTTVVDQSLDAKYGELNTPLHIEKELRIIRLLLDWKCSTNIPDKNGETAKDIPLNEKGDCLLHIASQWGDVAIVRHLIIDQRCNPNIVNSSGNTPLHIASKCGHMDVVKVVLSQKDCDPHISNEKGNTPLHTACMHGHHSTVEFLVADQRCQLNTRNREGKTPLNIASEHGHLYTVKALMSCKDCNPNISDEKGNTPLHIACLHGHLSTVEFLVADQRCQLNHQNREGKTPLNIASEHGHLYTVKAVMSCKDCNPNISDQKGNTPLYTACMHGHHSIVELLVADQRCQLDTKNSELSTPLHIACQTKELSIIRLLLDRICSINIPNTKGETAEDIPLNENGDCLLHVACQWGDVAIVKHLIINQKCNLNIKNATSDTALHIASKNGHMEVIKVFLSQKDCDPNICDEKGNTPLHTACKYGHHSTVELLVADQGCQLNARNGDGNTPLHIACCMKTLSIIRLLLQIKCSTSIPNKIGKTPEGIPLNDDGDSLLHIACLWGDVDMVKYLITDQTCDPNALNKYHLTPLLASINHGNALVASTLFQNAKCDLSLSDKAGNTALHLACISGQTHPEMVKVAKNLIVSVNPLCVNSAGQTPVELTTNYELIQSISHFTQCKAKHSVQTYINLFIVGNPETGKSSLVKAICKEASILWIVIPKVLRRVKNVPPHTAGIIPTTFRSRNFGNTVLYDLAGQTEYYTSHAAVIQATVISTPPAFVIVVNMSDSEEKVNETLRYWWCFINNLAARASAPPQVILVGSHADKMKGSVQEKMSQISALLKYLPTSFDFAGQVALDCRDPASRELRLFSSLVNHSCVELRKTADVDLHCHVLYAYLLDKFPSKVACTVSDITTSIQESDALLPQNPDLLIPLIATLSDKGLLLLVEESGSRKDSWVILQKQVLIAEINGTIFAPKHFRENKDLSSSTGVVPSCKLKCEFPRYNPIMIAKFLLHLEFCFKINDHQTLELLKEDIVQEENATQSLPEEYYFFPALVSVEYPLKVWEQDNVMLCQCGWLYRCIRHDQFLTTQFLHVLILSLAFSFALQFDPGDSHENSLVLHHRCSVWKRGIGWLNRVTIETVVEVGLLNQSVIVMMRHPKGKEAKCAQLRSEIIQKVLQARDEHCKAVEMSESFIHPSDVKYPFTENTEDYIRYSLTEIGRATIKEADNVLDHRGRNPFPIKDLLLFDPYFDASAELLSELFSKKHSLNEQVRGEVLQKATFQTSLIQETAQEISTCSCEEQLTTSQERGHATATVPGPTLDGVPWHSTPHPAIVQKRGQVGGITQELTDDDISQHRTKPTLPDLLKFTCIDGRVINIPVEIATKYVQFGTFLLNDRNGSKVTVMAHKHLNDAERINTEILQEWLTGRGKQPVTWATLVEVLHDIELSTLAGDISTSKCPSSKCSSEQ